MAFSAGLVFEVRQAGSDANGGAFRGGAALATPSAPSVSQAGTGGTVGAGTYYVVTTLTDGNGETPKSAQTSVTTTGTTSTVTVTSPANPNVQNATWNVYVGTTSGGPYFAQGTGLAFGANRLITATPPTSGTQAPGVDYSQQDAAQVALTDMVIDGTTNTLFSSATLGTNANLVGNVVNVTGGTGFTVQRVEITGVSSAGKYTADKSLGTLGSTGGTGNLGGGLATPGQAGALASSASQTIYVKYSATAYACSATSNVAGGRLSVGCPLVGYDTTRARDNTDANRPTLNAGANSMTVVTLTGGTAAFCLNIIVSANAHTAVTGYSTSTAGTVLHNCKAAGCATGFSLGNGNQTAYRCEANACTVGYTSGNSLVCDSCTAVACAGDGFQPSGGQLNFFRDCVATGSTAGGNGFNCTGTFTVCESCVSYGNAGAGFRVAGSGPAAVFLNCASYGNTGVGYTALASAQAANRLVNCAGGGNSSNYDLPGYQANGFITLTANPFTNAAGNDFSPNATAGGGTLLRAAGVPGAVAANKLPGLSTNSYPDVGAAQHADPAGGGVSLARVFTGM